MNGTISEASEKRITIAIAIALISLIPSIVIGVMLWHEIGARTEANRVQIREIKRNEIAQERLRAEARAAVRMAELANCKDLELVKGRLRSIVQFDPEEVALTLEQLGIDPSSERGQRLTARARRNSDEALKALRSRDCSEVPAPER